MTDSTTPTVPCAGEELAIEREILEKMRTGRVHEIDHPDTTAEEIRESGEIEILDMRITVTPDRKSYIVTGQV